MAIDQNSVPKGPLPLNLYPYRPSAPFQLSCYNAANSSAADKLADNQPAARKVKLLCSFGGKILPRPSDGAFRYAGGQTRIIAVRRDITIYELYRKMADAYGAPVAIRYQLPNEDLDALVSVSSAEDLDNMMDEYDKLTEVSGDGSAKLRVFLFSQAENASALTDNYFAGPALIYTFHGGQVYVEAVNGVSVSDDGIYSSEIRPKENMASPSSTLNSNAGFNGSYNEGSSPGIVSPITGVSASVYPSMLPFPGTATSVPLHEAQGFPPNSTVFGQAMVAAQSLNPPHVAPYASQAFVESHQVPYMPPHSLNMAAAGKINVVSAPQHTYLPSMPIPPSSMPAPVGTAKPIQEKWDPFLEGDQLSGRFVNPFPDHNYKVFQQTLSQAPPLQPSHLPPPSIEPYGLHLVPPLAQGPVLRFENWHSDRLVNELSNVSGVHVPKDHPIVHSYHCEDIARLQGQHRVVSVAMIESSMEPKVEPTVNPGQCGTYGANNVPDSVLDREKIFPLGALGLSGDTQASYGVFVSPPQSHFESSFQQQQKQALNGDYFHAAKVLHPTAAFTLSNGASLSPPQTRLNGSLQQQNVLLPESADYIQVLHPSRLSSTDQTSYGVSVEPLQSLHDASLHLKRLLAGTPPPFFPAKQTVIGNQCSKDSSSINNISHNVLEPLSQCQYNLKQVDGLMEALNVSTFDSLRFRDQLKPKLVPNVGLPKDMKPENLYAVGDNNTFRLQNGSNASLSSNAFLTSVVGPEGIYINPVNPAALSTGFSREIRPGSSSVVGVDNNTLRPQCDGSNLPSSEAFINTGLLSKENFMGPINPLLSTMMEVHASELANTCQASTIARSSALYTQSSQLLPGVSPYISDYAYTNTIAEGTSRVWKDEVCQVQNSFDYLAASQRGNAPFPLFSSIVPGQGGQFQENFDPYSLLNNEGPQEILGSMNAYLPRPAIVATRKPIISGDTSNENRLPKGQSPDVAILLEEGAHHPPLDWLIKESRLDPVIDYIDQDLRDIAEQVGESALQSSPPVSLLPFRRPEEMLPLFLCSHTLSENCLPKGQSPDIAALRPPLDWLINESRPDPFIDYIDQDLHDLAQQVAESVLQFSIPPLSVLTFSGPKEINHAFLRGIGLSGDNSTSQNANDLVDQIIEDKPGQLDKLHMGLMMANHIGRLQIIKNSDLEELRELGSGTFGTVYHGKWRGSDVAIKRINDRCFTGKPSEQERMRADFWNEANKLAALHHPNVITFYGVVIDGPSESLATVTEYMVNGSLRNALMRDDKTLDRWKCLLIAMDVAFGMEYLHAKNIVHFDLKSDNLLVNLRDPQRPICKIGDLGLSKIKCETLISGGVRGTLPWMAPELLNGCSNMASEKVDVFSFGIVMWELLTGEEPYSDLHCGAIIGGILTNTLRPTVPDSCDPEWGSLMEQCWSTDPTERPSFTEIAERLRSMAASFPQKGQAQT